MFIRYLMHIICLYADTVTHNENQQLYIIYFVFFPVLFDEQALLIWN